MIVVVPEYWLLKAVEMLLWSGSAYAVATLTRNVRPPYTGKLLTTRLEHGRRLKVALPSNGIGTAATTARRHKHSNGFRHSNYHSSDFRNDT